MTGSGTGKCINELVSFKAVNLQKLFNKQENSKRIIVYQEHCRK